MKNWGENRENGLKCAKITTKKYFSREAEQSEVRMGKGTCLNPCNAISRRAKRGESRRAKRGVARRGRRKGWRGGKRGGGKGGRKGEGLLMIGKRLSYQLFFICQIIKKIKIEVKTHHSISKTNLS